MAVTLPPLMVTAPQSMLKPPPMPASSASVAVAVSSPVPPLWAYMVRLLPWANSMPLLTLSVHPSVRMRYTFPVTVTRASMEVSPSTTYQPPVVLPFQAVSSAVTRVAVAVFSAPLASMYLTDSSSRVSAPMFTVSTVRGLAPSARAYPSGRAAAKLCVASS